MTDTGIIELPDFDKGALAVFTTPGAIDPILADIRKRIDAFVGDVTTKRGREEIASFAYKLARSKTFIDDAGKTLVAEMKEIPKKIDASRKHVRDTLDLWRDELRAPLTKWETDEAARVERHVKVIEALSRWNDAGAAATIEASSLRVSLASVETIEIGPHLEEFETEYARAKDRAIAVLKTAITAREKFEADQADLARLRKEQREREQRDRDEAIAREATQRAMAAAERASREAAERATQEAERQQAAAVAAEKAQREEAERREAQARLEAEAANRRAAEATATAQREAEERDRREKKEAAEREADQTHRRKINRAAVNALVGNGIPEEFAKLAISQIALRAIPRVKIEY